MRVLVVTNMYPNPAAQHAGVFIQREVEALREVHDISELEVVYVDTVASSVRYATGRIRVAAAIAHFRPDVIHVHYGLSQLMVPGMRVPKVVTFHGSDLAIPWQRRISTLLAGGAAELVCVSEPMSAGLKSLGLSATTIPCGVPVDFDTDLGVAAARERLSIPHDVLVLGFPSSPARAEKDYGLFSEILKLLEGSIGVCLAGVAPAEVPVWLRAVDACVYTSRREGSPVLSKEALTMGTRVVAVPVGDLASQLDGFSGCLVTADRDAGSLAAAVTLALGQPGPDRHIARSRFSVTAEASCVAEVYRRAIG